MSLHRYPFARLAPDYLRGVAGLAVSGGAWALSPGSVSAVVICGGLTALFTLFTIRTALRQTQRVEVTDEAIGMRGAAGGPLPWREIDGVALRYYATRRHRGGGWMTLKLRAGRRRLAVDSQLEGFDLIAARAAEAARRNRLGLTPTTLANFDALGLRIGQTEGRGDAAEAPR